MLCQRRRAIRVCEPKGRLSGMLASYERGGFQASTSYLSVCHAISSKTFSDHVLQIKRAMTVKSHYLHTERQRLAQKKEEAETRAATPGGIMGLNLIAQQVKENPAPEKAPAETKEKSKTESGGNDEAESKGKDAK